MSSSMQDLHNPGPARGIPRSNTLPASLSSLDLKPPSFFQNIPNIPKSTLTDLSPSFPFPYISYRPSITVRLLRYSIRGVKFTVPVVIAAAIFYGFDELIRYIKNDNQLDDAIKKIGDFMNEIQVNAEIETEEREDTVIILAKIADEMESTVQEMRDILKDLKEKVFMEGGVFNREKFTEWAKQIFIKILEERKGEEEENKKESEKENKIASEKENKVAKGNTAIVNTSIVVTLGEIEPEANKSSEKKVKEKEWYDRYSSPSSLVYKANWWENPLLLLLSSFSFLSLICIVICIYMFFR